MTIQQVLSNYPEVEKAFKEKFKGQTKYVLPNRITGKLLIDGYASFLDLQGFVMAFLRDNFIDLTICPAFISISMDIGAHTERNGFTWKVYYGPNEIEYEIFNDRRFANDYETAFISALEAACKYLNPKL